jgi:nucleotide-binding universal stress UspA family protein
MRNVALYTKSRVAPSVAHGILDEIAERDNVRLVLAGWPTPLEPEMLSDSIVKQLIQKASTDVGVLLDRGLTQVQRILVPLGGGSHSRMALRMAYEIAVAENAAVLVLQVMTSACDIEEFEDHCMQLEEIIAEVLGEVPPTFSLRVVESGSVLGGILAESTRRPYDLIVIGASEEWASDDHLFGAIGDRIATMASCSILLCRRHEPVTLARLRHSIKLLERGPVMKEAISTDSAPLQPLSRAIREPIQKQKLAPDHEGHRREPEQED